MNEKSKKLQISIDYRITTVMLLLVVIVMAVVWKPWVHTGTSTRKVTITGTGTVKSVPDEYTLSPYFEFTSTDTQKVKTEASALGQQITAKLKELGVKDEQIKSTTSNYDKYQPDSSTAGSETTLQLSYTITLQSKDIAQKVQDYVLTLNAKGHISPQANFSESKSKQLEAEARKLAIDDAKSKAQKTANELGSKIGRVITVSDDTNGSVRPMMNTSVGASLDSDAAPSMVVQPGQNDFTSSVQVEYELK